MTRLTPDQHTELARFPSALRTLVEAELAAGNTIEEMGRSHPAPPVGAYVKLARKVTTRPRISTPDLSFYERQSSLSSGEFTDAQRFFFVLEAPDPPPPEPDQEAIRQAHAPPPVASPRPPRIRARPMPPPAPGPPTGKTVPGEPAPRHHRPSAPVPRSPATDSSTGTTHVLHFRDQRSPHDVRVALEGELMTLFTPALDDETLVLQATAFVNGARYDLDLRFVAALSRDNAYSLSAQVSWAGLPPTYHADARRSSNSWFQLWTQDLKAATPPAASAGSKKRYRELCEAALQAETPLDSIDAIRQAIIAGMRSGGTYRTSHKEGGTNISWHNGRFVRADFGDYPDLKVYQDEAEFLEGLRRFLHWEVTRHAGKEPLSEFDIWKLILRRMNPGVSRSG